MNASLAIQIEQILLTCILLVILVFVWGAMLWLKDYAKWVFELGCLAERRKHGTTLHTTRDR